MINQPDPVFAYTIPYFISKEGETDELFVSEKTYEKYVKATKNETVIIIDGLLHPVSANYGEATLLLIDQNKAIIVIGTKDLQEYTNELLDIAIAQELEKLLYIEKADFFRFLYKKDTPDTIKIFIDDIQQIVEEICIAKRLKKDGYRIAAREQLLLDEVCLYQASLRQLKQYSPYEHEQGIYLLTKLFFLASVEKSLFQQAKKQLQKHYPLLFLEVNELEKLTKKLNFSTANGRQRALLKIFKQINYLKHVKKIAIDEIPSFQLEVRL